MSICSEWPAIPSKGTLLRKRDDLLSRREAEKGREGLWHPKERDGEPTSGRGVGIPSEPLGKREPIMRPLRA